MFPKISFAVGLFQLDPTYVGDLAKCVKKANRMAARAFLLAAVSAIPVRTGFLRGAFGNLEEVVGSVVGGTVIPSTNPAVKRAKLLKQMQGIEHKITSVPSKAQRRRQAEAQFAPGKKRAGASKLLKEQDIEIAKDKNQLKKVKARFKSVSSARVIERFADQTFRTGEYYYPSPVGRHGKQKGVHRGILKTTSSGQPFATPASSILRQGNNVSSWVFTFEVDINYYAYNDNTRGWNSWRYAVEAFYATFQDEISQAPQILSYLRIIKGQIPGQMTFPTLETVDQFEIQSNG